jgi:solute carrier family 25 (mitochondrial folate transporter), member 32
LIKVRYQVYDKSGSSAYRSLHSAFQTIVRREGVRGLFQGLAPAVLASAVSWGGYLYFYEHAKVLHLTWFCWTGLSLDWWCHH